VKRQRNKAGHNEGSNARGGHNRPAPDPWLAYGNRHAYGVSANRLGDILDTMAAKWTVTDSELVPDLLIDGVGDTYGARLCKCLKAGGNVDAITKDVVSIDDNVPEIDTYPQFETALRRDKIVDGTRGALHLDGAVQRIDDARKIR
jgi:hypothetical protein